MHTHFLSTLVIAALVYFIRFALLLGVEAALFYWVARNTCRPLADLSAEQTFGGAIPPEATCYTRDHGVIAFHDFHPLAEDPIPAILTAGLLLCFLGLLFRPGFWIGSGGAARPVISVRQAGFAMLAIWIATFPLVAIFPDVAGYQGLVPIVLLPAAAALLLGRPKERGKRSEDRASEQQPRRMP